MNISVNINLCENYKMKKLNCIFLIFSIILLISGVVAACILYPNYGKGLHFYILIVLPLLFLLSGYIAFLWKKWWIVILVEAIILGIYGWIKIGNEIKWFVFLIIVYLIIGLLNGVNCGLIRKSK